MDVKLIYETINEIKENMNDMYNFEKKQKPIEELINIATEELLKFGSTLCSKDDRQADIIAPAFLCAYLSLRYSEILEDIKKIDIKKIEIQDEFLNYNRNFVEAIEENYD